ncbi:MAG: FtsX-like permease family protein [Acidobacteria bacterium]|nr:FtsX-like permease family protein [Acidobacteriota bacterium]
MALPIKYNIRNVLVRKGTTLATATSIGITVAVFLMVMALARGIDLTLQSSGEPLNLIVLREGATAELVSDIDQAKFDTVKFLDGVATANGEPLAAAEAITLLYRPRKGQSQGANVTIRGTGPQSTALRSGFRIDRGRAFQPGLAEAIVSQRIADRFQALDVGDRFKIQNSEFTIVGVFDAGGKAFESEIWVDINALKNATNRPTYSSVLLRVSDAAALSTVAARIAEDQRLQLKATPEVKWYEDQGGATSGTIKGLGVFIAAIMAVGAGFAGMNTMYAAVANRTKEIGTLRVLGFGRLSILLSFVLESVTIAVIGAAIGIVLALPLNFVSTGTNNFTTFSEIAFNFRVTWDLMVAALLFGAGIGLFGSLLPSIRASRFAIVDALREN